MSLLVIAACALFASYALYRIHLHPQRQYGELVMALFDQFLSKLTFVDSAAWIAVAKGGGWPANQAERYKSVVRLLRYSFVRPRGLSRTFARDRIARLAASAERASARGQPMR